MTETALASLKDALAGLWTPALVLLAFALWRHRKDARDLLRRLRPESLGVNATSFVIDALLIVAPVSLLAGWLTGLVRSRDLVLFGEEAWASLPAPVALLAAVFFGDFVAYWRHRLEHAPALWSSHVMHHSDTTMTWLTVYRFHPINRLTTVAIDSMGLALIGAPAWVVGANAIFRHYYGIFVHMDVPWTLGPLGRVLVSPAMHRWHHVKEGPGVGCNFASVFSLFDRAFGTHYCPGPCDVPLGVDGVEHRSYWSQLVLPARELWRWLRPIKAATVP